MSDSEFSRWIDVRQTEGKQTKLLANEAERAALAQRFGLVSIGRLEADILLTRDGLAIDAKGVLDADIVQSCAISGEDLPVAVREELSFRFVPAGTPSAPDEEVELDAEDCDEIEYSGTQIDLGEAIAQSLALAIDPFAEGPEADEARRTLLGKEPGGAFAGLADLMKKD